MQIAKKYESTQAEILNEWTEKQKSKRRIKVMPRTQVQEEIELARIQKVMDCIGMAGVAIAGLLVAMLLVYHV